MGAVEQRFGEPHDALERGAQLVGGVGQELVLEPVDLAQAVGDGALAGGFGLVFGQGPGGRRQAPPCPTLQSPAGSDDAGDDQE